MSDHAREVMAGERFGFGKNWARFLEVLDEDRIRLAERSLSSTLNFPDLAGKTFVDAGSGSGLFSLAARRLGARVRSFDFDPQSVACTRELKRRYYPGDPGWIVEQGSVLDGAYIAQLGRFDVVYSWGVLHHTGSLWQALENVIGLMEAGGKLCISIYNDQGRKSRRWAAVKRTYNRSPRPLRVFISAPAFLALYGRTIVRDCLKLQPFHTARAYRLNRSRGMSLMHDFYDWIGGYPFEVAKPERVFAFCRERGLILERLSTCGGTSGCNEFVFENAAGAAAGANRGAVSLESQSAL
jgi:2-polyprenyl-6-hydroxyphenyl methylase/3-demethylubiquinone-9 3-methyltransferase